MEKQIEYAIKLQAHIAEIFEEENSNYIDSDELNDGENVKCFIHALATLIPAFFYKRLCSDELKDHLELNHIANRLVVEFNTAR